MENGFQDLKRCYIDSQRNKKERKKRKKEIHLPVKYDIIKSKCKLILRLILFGFQNIK